jgi:hypothetical protein
MRLSLALVGNVPGDGLGLLRLVALPGHVGEPFA